MLATKHPETKVVIITPEVAEKMLEGNVHNRPVHQSIVEQYADQMKRKLWQLNGESVVIDKTGTLLDGQHRLWACIESKTSFETVVVFGIEPESFSTIDTGSKRSAADVLHIAGITRNIAVMAASANICIGYRRGSLRSKGNRNNAITRSDILKFVQLNKGLEMWVEKALSGRGWEKSYASPVAAVVYLGATKYREKAEEFMLGWTTGENLGSKSPILALRHRLGTEKRLPRIQRIGLVIHAWNSFVDNKQLVILKMPKGDDIVIRGTEHRKGSKAE